MKLKVSKEVLLEGLQKVQPVVGQKTTLPVLQNILFKADKEKLWLSATDLDLSVRVGIEAEVFRTGATTLPARRCAAIFKELPAGDIEIETDDKDHSAISSGAAYFRIIGISADEFPPLPRFEGGKTYTIDQNIFREMLRNVSCAASTDPNRLMLNGVLLSFKSEKLEVVATDGRRMAHYEQELEFPKDAEADIVLPAKTVDELSRTLGTEGSLKIQVTDKQAAFEFNELLIISKLLEGTFPNFRQVIPAQSEERIRLNREEFLNTIRRVALIATDGSNSIRLSFSKNKLEIAANSPEVGEARETLAIAYTGKSLTVAFNPDFLMAPLRNLVCDEIFLELTDDLSPGVIKCALPFLYVLMPMRLS